MGLYIGNESIEENVVSGNFHIFLLALKLLKVRKSKNIPNIDHSLLNVSLQRLEVVVVVEVVWY